MQQLAHVRGVVRHAPALFDLLAQLGQSPRAQARGLHVRSVQHHLLQRRFLCPVQPRRPAWMRSVVQSGKPLGVVAHHGIAQCLPFHACQPGCFGPRQALERTRDGLHPRRSRSVLLPPRQPTQLRRRQVCADCQCPSTHSRPLPAGVDTTRIISARVASNHVRVRKSADRY
jgi:hypothetical protein